MISLEEELDNGVKYFEEMLDRLKPIASRWLYKRILKQYMELKNLQFENEYEKNKSSKYDR